MGTSLGAYGWTVLPTPRAFASRELWLNRRMEVDPPNQNSTYQKFVVAKCRKQHARGARSREKMGIRIHEDRHLWPND